MAPKLPTLCRALLLMCLSIQTADAQLISVRTAPVSVPEQFYTFPSQLMGMGGSLVLDDVEADPFGNPATGARLKGTFITGTPTLYRLIEDNGFGRTLPVAVLSGSDEQFGGLSFAVQEIESAQPNSWFQPITPVRRSDRFAQNTYFSGFVGQKFADKRSAVGLSASYAGIDALHMVQLLYPQAERIEQGGSMSDVRFGYLRQYDDDGALEAVLVRNHVDMEHTVTFVDRVWGPNWQQPPTETRRTEYNSDKTTTWGAHLGYRAPRQESGWQLAGAFTANTKNHPKIPNYTFMSIPRDPGNSWALGLGLGIAHTDTASLWSFDLKYEPVWTTTWAEAASEMKSASGRTINIGDPTIENEFVFSNTTMHVGYMRKYDVLGLQAGLTVLRVNYWLSQYSHITELPREQEESWTELTLHWGMTFALRGFDLRYFGHLKGPGISFGAQADAIAFPTPGGGGPDIVAAPSGPLNMDATSAISHQFGFSIPIGRKR